MCELVWVKSSEDTVKSSEVVGLDEVERLEVDCAEPETEASLSTTEVENAVRSEVKEVVEGLIRRPRRRESNNDQSTTAA